MKAEANGMPKVERRKEVPADTRDASHQALFYNNYEPLQALLDKDLAKMGRGG